VHVSTGRGVSQVAEARARGVDVSFETCPHYLVLAEDDLEELGAVAKCAPPLRPSEEQAQLWQHLLAGTLPMVASDHSPSPPWMKGIENVELKIENDSEAILNSQFSILNFFKVWGGISGCQSTLQLLLTDGHARRGLPLEIIAAVTSEFVARRFGLAPRKGRLAVGADADLALVDLSHSARLHPSDLLYRHRISPYVGRTLRGRVARTLVRGTTVCLDGRIVSPPIGRLLTPA
jgi:allantoinase